MATSSAALPLPELVDRVRAFDNGLVISLGRGGGQTGGDVWKGAFCLQRFLAANPQYVAGKGVCELGSGTGFLAMSAHMQGSSHCVATDKFMKVLVRNVQDNEALLQKANSGGHFDCVACDWEEVQRTGALPPALAPRRFDLIIASDTIYYHAKYVHAFVAVVVRLLTSSPHAKLLLCQSYRGAPDLEQMFFDGITREGLQHVLVSQDANSPDRHAMKAMNVAIWQLWCEPGRCGVRSHLAALWELGASHRIAPLLELSLMDGRTQWIFSTVAHL